MSDTKSSADLVEPALASVVRAAGSAHTTVGIWLVWMHERRVLLWEWVNRLDVAVPVCFPAGANGVVIVAVAPTRIAGAVIGRVDVICEQAEAAGLTAEAVHVSALKAGALWTCLRANGFGGIVPSPTDIDRPALRRRPLGWFVRTRSLRRISALVMAPVVYVVCAMAGVADPGGQAGVIAAPGPGQAGVTAAPAKPSQHRLGPDVTVNVPRSQSPVPMQTSPRSWAEPDWNDTSDGYSVEEVVDDTLHVGTTRIARPDWMARELADSERAWNGYLASQAGIGLAQARTVAGEGTQSLGEAGLTDLAVVVGEASGAAAAEVSAVVGSGEGELPEQGLAELTEIAVATLPQWQTPAQAMDSAPGEVLAGDPIGAPIQLEVDRCLSQLPLIPG